MLNVIKIVHNPPNNTNCDICFEIEVMFVDGVLGVVLYVVMLVCR